MHIRSLFRTWRAAFTGFLVHLGLHELAIAKGKEDPFTHDVFR